MQAKTEKSTAIERDILVPCLRILQVHIFSFIGMLTYWSYPPAHFSTAVCQVVQSSPKTPVFCFCFFFLLTLSHCTNSFTYYPLLLFPLTSFSSSPGAVARLDAHPPSMGTIVGSIITSGNTLSWNWVRK